MGAGVVWSVTSRPKPEPPPAEADPFPLTPVSSSPYLNTGPDARYVGSETCRSCHPDRHESFRRTGMGRSMAAVDPAKEPADATYDHALSKRRYQVYRKEQLPFHTMWRMLGEGIYGVAMEPTTNRDAGRSDARERGELAYIAPQESRRYELEIGALDGEVEIDAFAGRVSSLIRSQAARNGGRRRA